MKGFTIFITILLVITAAAVAVMWGFVGSDLIHKQDPTTSQVTIIQGDSLLFVQNTINRWATEHPDNKITSVVVDCYEDGSEEVYYATVTYEVKAN